MTGAVIFGLEGTTLSAGEEALFRKVQPAGYILFTRNCESPEQLRALVQRLHLLHQGRKVLILIDQEGGRVARLKPPHWRKSPAAAHFAQLQHEDDIIQAVYANARLIAQELHALGINVNCAPLADIPIEGAHDIIGDRAYGQSPESVARRARAMAEGLLDGGVLPVLKHIPGHGRARADSHEELPVVDASRTDLEKTDFAPFKALCDLPLGMTAHILYTAIDPGHPATLSPAVLRVIREDIGFDGLLMSDDISMKALKGDLGVLSRQTLEAGCDLVLHCNGNMQEMQAIAHAITPLSPQAQARLTHALSLLRAPSPFDYNQAAALVDKLAV